MGLDIPHDERFGRTGTRQRAKRVTPVRTPADAASQIFELYDAARKAIGDQPITAQQAYYLSSTLKNMADLRLTQALADNVVEGIERRLTELEDRLGGLELINDRAT